MKRVFVLLCCIAALNASAQRSITDSLFKIINSKAHDSVKVDAAMTIFVVYQRDLVDTLSLYAQAVIDAGKKQSNPRVEAAGLLGLGFSYGRKYEHHNYYEHTRMAAKIEEKYPSALLRAYINRFMASLATDEDGIFLMRKSLQGYDALSRKDIHSVGMIINMAGKFDLTTQFDSARYYARKAEFLAEEIGDTLNEFDVYSTLGEIYLDKDKNTTMFYLQRCLSVAERTQYDADYSSVYNDLTTYYSETGNRDSLIYYAEEAEMIDNRPLLDQMFNSAALYTYYRFYEKDNHSAVEYADDFFSNLDTIFTPILNGTFQKMAFGEVLDQEKKEQEKKQLEKEQRRNLQKIILSLIIVSLIVSFLLVSRAVFANLAFIRYMGVITLLLAFEYINLVIEPILEKYIGEYVPLMLVSLAAIAALLAPIHHYLSKWVDKKVSENKEKKRIHARETLKKYGEPGQG